MGKRRRKVIPRNLTALKTIAKETGMNEGVLGKQIRSGAFGSIPIVRLPDRKTRQTSAYIPSGHAKPIISLHQTHLPLETASKQLKEHKNMVRRQLQRFAELPESHPAIRKIGGRIRHMKKGKLNYILKRHLPRLRAALKDFISLFEAARRMPKKYGMSANILYRLLSRGVLPGAVFVRGKLHNLVHKSIFRVVREFFSSHYTAIQAIRRARKLGVKEATLNYWAQKWGFPVIVFSRNERYFKKQGFEEAISAFKKGRNMAVFYVHKNVRQNYSPDIMTKRFGLKEEGIQAAVKIFNILTTRQEQLAMEKRFDGIDTKNRRLKHVVPEAREKYALLLLEEGPQSPLIAKIDALFGKMDIATIHNILVLLKRTMPERREIALEGMLKVGF